MAFVRCPSSILSLHADDVSQTPDRCHLPQGHEITISRQRHRHLSRGPPQDRRLQLPHRISSSHHRRQWQRACFPALTSLCQTPRAFGWSTLWQINHSVDHPRCLCSFPDVKGWNDPMQYSTPGTSFDGVKRRQEEPSPQLAFK